MPRASTYTSATVARLAAKAAAVTPETLEPQQDRQRRAEAGA